MSLFVNERNTKEATEIENEFLAVLKPFIEKYNHLSLIELEYILTSELSLRMTEARIRKAAEKFRNKNTPVIEGYYWIKPEKDSQPKIMLLEDNRLSMIGTDAFYLASDVFEIGDFVSAP